MLCFSSVAAYHFHKHDADVWRISKPLAVDGKHETDGGAFMKVGYIRVSKHEQNEDLQRDALIAAKCDKLFTDNISGSKAERKGLEQAHVFLRPGDTFVWAWCRPQTKIQSTLLAAWSSSWITSISAPGNPSVGRISSIIGRIHNCCDGADKSAMGAINRPLQLVCQQQIHTPFTLFMTLLAIIPGKTHNKRKNVYAEV
jgi:hypothetical protein